MIQYTIIVVPPPDICKKVDEYRKKYACHTNYVITPHFTVYPPFYITSGNEDEIIRILNRSFKGTEIKVVNLEGIGFFEGKNKVAFFNLDKKSEEYFKKLLFKATTTLQGKVKNVYADYNFPPEKFKPHMTIAEKILGDTFIKVKTELDKIEEKDSFIISSAYLFKQLDNSNVWTKVEEIKF